MSDEPTTRAASRAPRDNPELVGQAAAEAVLLRAAETGRLPHAWLLTGPRGVGKATLAYRFARYLLAQVAKPQDELGLFGEVAAPAEAPGAGLFLAPEHPVFRRVASGGHPDLMVLELQANPRTGKPRSEIVVEQVHRAREFLHLTPAEGGWRVVVVDSADDLNLTAANGLLKVLEEPSRQSLLLLVGHAPGRLLPTIRSRCCHLALAPLDEESVVALLARAAPDLAAQEAHALARLADGSVGRALELAETGGLELYGELVSLLSGLSGKGDRPPAGLDTKRLHGLADRLSRGADPGAFRAGRDLLLWSLARAVRARSLGRTPAEVTPGEGAVVSGLAARGSLADWVALWDKVSQLLARVETANLDRKQALLAAFLELEALARAE